MSITDSIYTRLDNPWSATILDQYGMPFRQSDSLSTERNRSRRLEEQSGLAYGILSRSTENVIGVGIGVRPKSDFEDFNKEVTDKWSDAIAGKMLDVRRMFSFGELQRIGYRSKKLDGDCGYILIDRMDQGFMWPEMQYVPGEMIETPSASMVGDRRIIDGVELNDGNAAVAYWIKSGKTHVRVEARDFIFLCNTTKYNVVRGTPQFKGTYRLFDQLEGHIEAVVVAARIAACQAVIVKRKGGGAKISKLGTTASADGRIVPARVIEPGMFNFIDEGEEWQGFNPNQPHQDFPGFVTTIARILGLKFGLTVERVLLDFSKATYSTSRSTALQETQTAQPEQESMVASMLLRFYPFWVAKLIKRGRIKSKIPPNPWAFEWIPQGRPLVEPSKEAPGLRQLIEMGVEAPEYIATERGYDWNKLLATLAKNKKELETLGLSLTMSPIAKVAGTAAVAEADAADAAERAAKGLPPNGDPVDPTDPTGEGSISDPKAAADSYGIAVRAGVITPQSEDESLFRKILKLPAMGAAALKAWAKDDGTRRPITITPPPDSTTPPTNGPTDANQVPK